MREQCKLYNVQFMIQICIIFVELPFFILSWSFFFYCLYDHFVSMAALLPNKKNQTNKNQKIQSKILKTEKKIRTYVVFNLDLGQVTFFPVCDLDK